MRRQNNNRHPCMSIATRASTRTYRPLAAALPQRGRGRRVRRGVAVGGGGSGVDSGRSGRAALELAVGPVRRALGPVIGRVVEPLAAGIVGTAILDLCIGIVRAS